MPKVFGKALFFMQRIICFSYRQVVSRLKLKKYIVFESYPPYSDSTFLVFKKMINDKRLRKYKFIWSVPNDFTKSSIYERTSNICFDYEKLQTFKDKIRRIKYLYSAKCFVSCNHFLSKVRKNQRSYYIPHGIPIKRIKDYYNMPDGVDICISPSESTNAIFADQLNIGLERIIAIDSPRIDSLSKRKINIKQSVFNNNYNYLVVWYPTFRQHKNGATTASSVSIPFLFNSNNAKQINNVAKENKMLIIIKPHYAQDVSFIKELKLSNILFIDESFFDNYNISSYDFINGCDALITDYSSVYFDYLLTDNQMAVIWEDRDKYKKNPGFAIDIDYYLLGAVKVYQFSELLDFLTDVANDNDRKKSDRKEIRNLINMKNDGQCTDRVVNYLITDARL